MVLRAVGDGRGGVMQMGKVLVRLREPACLLLHLTANSNEGYEYD